MSVATAAPGAVGDAGPVDVPTLADQWGALASAALLGTARRPPPPPLPGVLCDLLADRLAGDDASEALDQVAVLTVVRRAGVRPNPATAALLPCPDDPRPPTPPAASARLAGLLTEWPMLVDEWLHCAADQQWRLSAETAVVLLERFRGDPPRRARVVALAGPLADWLTQLWPDVLAPGRASRVDSVPPGGASGPAGSPGPSASDPPTIPDDIVELAALPPDELAAALAARLESNQLGTRNRASLLRFVGALPVEALPSIAERLLRAGSNADTMGLALTLADLARTRLDLRAELRRPTPAPDTGTSA
jgi:hypothetical protein